MTKKTAQLGLFLSLALILAYVESLIPFSFGIPGIKLGLPNLIVVMLLCQDTTAQNGATTDDRHWFGASEAILVNILRIILSGFLFSNLYTIIYSLAGAAFSVAAMMFGRRFRCFSVVGISVLGGVFHNIGQILMAIFVVETVYVGYYVPVLIAAGTVTGAVLGIVAMELIPYLTRLSEHGQNIRA